MDGEKNQRKKKEMRANFSVISSLNEKQKDDLFKMYQNEWWSKDRSKNDVDFILQNSSFIIAIINKKNDELCAFSRILTDYFRFSYVYDVIVNSPYRGQGVGKMLLQEITQHPIVKKVGSIELVCRKGTMPFYQQFDFTEDYGLSIAMRKVYNS